jgi:hypothetical protein
VGRSPFRRDGFTNKSLNVFLEDVTKNERQTTHRCWASGCNRRPFRVSVGLWFAYPAVLCNTSCVPS